ncbi:hypothetical protein P280DRAFT_466658 [Massarina eburnea CBS 473.64]|uniref:TLC domain-containing protein n=1 Tax=Massarina eburnea CBS 473.64 TaxID=1395130 RepID=A0A6A6S7T8_9PLEO|nr:hypothetical protein P280DRAFT_466658 [Massarina eburnea CBS 473.64]
MFIVNGHQFAYSPITGSHVSVGDMMFIVSNMYTAMYAFELCYRTGISPVAWAHHTGTAIMAQYALVLSHDGHHRDGSLEQILCLVWGLFDIVSEAIPHFTFILYRLFPTRHAYLHRWLLTATVVMLVSTALETGIVVWIYVALFSRWRSELRFLTPFMYCIFAVAQLWGAWALWGLTQKQKRLVESERGGVCLCLVVKVEEVRKNGGDDIELNVVNVVQPVNNKV